MAFNFGMTSSGSNNQSQASNQSQQNVWGQQVPFFQQLYGQGSGLLNQQQGAGPAAQGMVDQFMPGVMQGFQGMQNIAQTGGPIGQFANMMNPMVGQQIQQFGQGLGDFFQQQIMPGLQDNAIQAGQLGGSRQGVAEGIAAGNMAQQFQHGATSMLSNAYGQAQNAAGQATQAMMGAGGALGGMAGDAFNFGMAPFSAAWSPLQNMAGLLGGPQVLGQSSGQSSSNASSNSSGFNFGLGGGSIFG